MKDIVRNEFRLSAYVVLGLALNKSN